MRGLTQTNIGYKYLMEHLTPKEKELFDSYKFISTERASDIRKWFSGGYAKVSKDYNNVIVDKFYKYDLISGCS